MVKKVSRHSLHDCLKSIRQGDTRCRTCAKIYQRGRNNGLPGYCPTHGGDRTKEMTALRRNDSLPSHCPTHTKEQDKEMTVLGKIAVEMQDWFHQKSVKRYEERHGRLQRLEGLTDGEAWMWTRTRAAWLQCGHSLRDIGPHWWGHWFASEDDPNFLQISDIQKMMFNPEDHYGFRHCVFVVLLHSGHRYVVDPTGFQFGPQWPLVCPLEEYTSGFMHQFPEARNVQYLPLGTD
ncbi:hypothetical protein HBI56_007610 [Parastagonospora nodorum]|uniref:Uncharacterized protein n=2 Tax=Phaeosphaeria nodorum (strain SN15 / ATCC MYA-4574 / FGSC 10173) TaxID=321614 RepID=Q0V633_PHANO|nr:hypothetical protein SNOG_00531 [Parastagonospora nodorum SN15]KAH3912131.1 hypothetical protein HBH56_122110 [Parastagonospora nodorum]EAT92026.1 hypothetical protein SNOG_00531 [Parastagonospora nodorum SN15]KAH3935308.1 hypothetical protein HBH54_047660 [Parastagonospora nodorum]KAH3950067.1 hypothetical protein HBH53_076300 [Parastagonospora nodorum]KAH3987328.1 hypothetical protein HBH52_038030 [Parastagonospora nodorum]